MVRMAEYRYFYLDFDGVMCDSVKEAYFCSYLAYHRLSITSDPLAVDNKIIQQFYKYRPFIRSGQHLVFLQFCIARGILLRNHHDFERELSAVSSRQLREWRDLLYVVREKLTAHDMRRFLQLHALYPGIEELARTLSAVENVYILSTKREDIISLILGNRAIDWPVERIISVDTKGKIDAIQTHRGANHYSVFFVDDHLPHILNKRESIERNIDCYLADWGYTLPEWRRNNAYQHINSEHLLAYVFGIDI